MAATHSARKSSPSARPADSAYPAAIDPHAPKKVVLSPEALEKTAERLYTRDVKKIQQQRKEFNEAIEFKLHHNDVHKVGAAPLSPKEQAAVTHLYTQAKQRKEQSQEKLSQKFAGPSAT